MEPTLTNLGVGGVFALLLIREARELVTIVLTHRNGPGAGGDRNPVDAAAAVSSTARGKLHEMHKVVMREGADGVPLVYRHPDIAEALDAIAANTDTAAAHLAAIRERDGV